MHVSEGEGGGHFARGKLQRFTQACGNRRFADFDDPAAAGIPPDLTLRGKAADGPLRAGKGEISLVAGLD